jgi:hypothetical protein
VGEALAQKLEASEPKKCNKKLKPKEPTPCLIVAGGTMVESLLACLTSGRPRTEMIKARLRGGDAVLLSSAPLCGITGDDDNERWRMSSELWAEAMLKRNDWKVVHHLRGDGRKLPLELGGIPKVEKEVPTEFKTNLTAQWNRYAGAALIITDAQYMDIRKRAGLDQASGMGMPQQLVKAMKPLVKDYEPPADDQVYHHDHEYHQHSISGSHRRANSKGSRRSSIVGLGGGRRRSSKVGL